MRTAISSPGRITTFTALARLFTFSTFTSSSSAMRLRLKSFVRMGAFSLEASRISLASTSRASGKGSRPAAAAVAPQRLRRISDVAELIEDEAGDDQRALEEAGGRDVGDAAVDDGAGVDNDLARAVTRFFHDRKD